MSETIEVEVDWVAQQLREAASMLDRDGAPSCFWCGVGGPGLFWLPSEVGVIEMAVWNCARCIVRDLGPSDEVALLLRAWAAKSGLKRKAGIDPAEVNKAAERLSAAFEVSTPPSGTRLA